MPAILPQHFRFSTRLAAGVVLLLAPAAVTLLAEEKSTHVPVPAPALLATSVATSQAATAPSTQKLRELQRKEEDIARVMEFFRVTQPDVYEQAKTLRDTDPARFEKLVRPTINTVSKLEELRKKSPRLFDLTMKDLELNYHSLRLARQLKRPELAVPDRDRLASELAAIVGSQFDIRQEIRQQEIEDLKSQLKDLSDKLQSNEKVKTALIKKRVDDLVEKPPRLDW